MAKEDLSKKSLTELRKLAKSLGIATAGLGVKDLVRAIEKKGAASKGKSTPADVKKSKAKKSKVEDDEDDEDEEDEEEDDEDEEEEEAPKKSKSSAKKASVTPASMREGSAVVQWRDKKGMPQKGVYNGVNEDDEKKAQIRDEKTSKMVTIAFKDLELIDDGKGSDFELRISKLESRLDKLEGKKSPKASDEEEEDAPEEVSVKRGDIEKMSLKELKALAKKLNASGQGDDDDIDVTIKDEKKLRKAILSWMSEYANPVETTKGKKRAAKDEEDDEDEEDKESDLPSWLVKGAVVLANISEEEDGEDWQKCTVKKIEEDDDGEYAVTVIDEDGEPFELTPADCKESKKGAKKRDEKTPKGKKKPEPEEDEDDDEDDDDDEEDEDDEEE